MTSLSLAFSLLLTAYTTSNGVVGGFHLDYTAGGGLILRAGNALVDGAAYSAGPVAYNPPPLEVGMALQVSTFYYCYVSPVFAFVCSTTVPLEDGTPKNPLTKVGHAATSSAVSVGSFYVDSHGIVVPFYRNGSDVTLIEPQQAPLAFPALPIDPVDPGVQLSQMTPAADLSQVQASPGMSDMSITNVHNVNTDPFFYSYSIDQPLMLDEQAMLSVRNPGICSAAALPTELSAGNPAGKYTLNFGHIVTNNLSVLGVQRGYLEPIHAFSPNYLSN